MHVLFRLSCPVASAPCVSGLCLSPRRVCVCCSILRLFADPFALLRQRLVCHSKRRAGACCSVRQCIAVYCSVLQCIAVCCSVLQCVAVYCSVLQCVAVVCRFSCPVASLPCVSGLCLSPRRACVCSSVLQCVSLCCSCLPTLLPCRASALSGASVPPHEKSICVAACCSILQCVAIVCRLSCPVANALFSRSVPLRKRARDLVSILCVGRVSLPDRERVTFQCARGRARESIRAYIQGDRKAEQTYALFGFLLHLLVVAFAHTLAGATYD